MNVPLKAVVIGVALAAVIVLSHLLFPVLMVLLMLGLIRRVWFGSRGHFAYDGWGRAWGASSGASSEASSAACWGANFDDMRRHSLGAHRFGRMPTIDGGPWLHAGQPAMPSRDVPWL